MSSGALPVVTVPGFVGDRLPVQESTVYVEIEPLAQFTPRPALRTYANAGLDEGVQDDCGGGVVFTVDPPRRNSLLAGEQQEQQRGENVFSYAPPYFNS
jgi:hypothetical protein